MKSMLSVKAGDMDFFASLPRQENPAQTRQGASRYIGIKFVVSLKEAFVLYETVFAQLRQAVVRVRL